MALTKNWKIAGASAALAGFGAGAVLGLTPGGADGGKADRIDLRDQRPAVTAPAPDPVEGDDLDLFADFSPDGESIDSPLQSPDDSPDGADSIDTPGDPDSVDSADWNSVRSPASPQSAQSAASPASVQSVDSPEPARAPAPAPAPNWSVDSPASVQSVASAASVASIGSVDSPD